MNKSEFSVKSETEVQKNKTVLRYAGTANDSIVDGPGLRFAIFTQGCPHGCPGCHNPHTHDFNGGKTAELSFFTDKIRSNPLLDGVTFSGGEPFCQAGALAELADELKDTELNFVTYTGYTFEYLLKNASEENRYMDLLRCTDLLVDGPFIEAQKSIEIRFRGSRNQRLIDCKKSLAAGTVIEISEDDLY